MKPVRILRGLWYAGAALGAAAVHADPAAFDLAGPNLELTITRGARSLPAAQVPNLAVGDRIHLRADLPKGQGAHYLLVATFLRGATNPPPDDWFTHCETWKSPCASDGITLTVPAGAQEVLVFLAPETGGDFRTLVNAVRGRPGAFVRTSQDLNQATLDRSRLEAYLAAIRRIDAQDPSQLKDAAPLLARSLAIKVDEKCLGRIAVLQAPCLAQGRESLILDDGHGASIAQQLTSGPASDLAMEASSTPQLRSGYYGPFIGSAFDIARILDSFHTAQYQYIPALITAHGAHVQLTLNSPPSFHNPKSVLVVALPPVEAPQFPPLHAVDPQEVLCARHDRLELPVDGAPLVFSGAYAHDVALRLTRRDGTVAEVPVRADAARGGFVADAEALAPLDTSEPLRAALHGEWGFDPFTGPSFLFASARDQSWQLDPADGADLIVGRPATVHLRASSVSCLEELTLLDPAGKPQKVEWRKLSPREVEAKLPLQSTAPGEAYLVVRQYGLGEGQRLPLRTFTEAGHLESFAVHAGDTEGVLQGTRLDEVAGLTFEDVEFAVGNLATSEGRDQLTMQSAPGHAVHPQKAGETLSAHVRLKDGRTQDVRVSVDAARPSATLITRSVSATGGGGNLSIHLAGEGELSLQAQLTFSLRAQSPPAFGHADKVEVATAEGAASVMLGVADGGLVLQSARVAVATLEPRKVFDASAFGPLHFRRIVAGVPGPWQALATLVRLPTLQTLDCPAAEPSACTLSGSDLFLLESVSADAGFGQPTRVPDGFTGATLRVPRPGPDGLYVRLRDDPSVTSLIRVAANVPASPPTAAPDPTPPSLPAPAPMAARVPGQ